MCGGVGDAGVLVKFFSMQLRHLVQIKIGDCIATHNNKSAIEKQNVVGCYGLRQQSLAELVTLLTAFSLM